MFRYKALGLVAGGSHHGIALAVAADVVGTVVQFNQKQYVQRVGPADHEVDVLPPEPAADGALLPLGKAAVHGDKSAEYGLRKSQDSELWRDFFHSGDFGLIATGIEALR